MKAEFTVVWSKESKQNFERTIDYLRNHWTQRQVRKFVTEIKEFEHIVVRFPEIYAVSNKEPSLRRAVLSKHNSIIYKVDQANTKVLVISILDNREDPDKTKEKSVL